MGAPYRRSQRGASGGYSRVAAPAPPPHGRVRTLLRMASDVVTMDKIVALCKRRGFVFPASEIYGGIANTYDYGHYGVLLVQNVKNEWWKAMLQDRDDIVALTPRSSSTRRSGSPQATSTASPTRSSSAWASARSASA